MTGRSSATVTKAEITDSATLNEQTEARTSSPDVPRSHSSGTQPPLDLSETGIIDEFRPLCRSPPSHL
jgi:hypothetical protein